MPDVSKAKLGQQPVALLFAPAVVQSGQGGDQHGYQRNPSGTAHQAGTLPGAVGGTSACDPSGGFPLGDRRNSAQHRNLETALQAV